MVITKDIQQFIAFSEDDVLDVLKKISSNKSRIVFVVSEQAVLQGCVSDGDVRRWLTGESEIDLTQPVHLVMNKKCRSLPLGSSREEISSLFTNGIECVPLVDELGRLVQLAFQRSHGFFVGAREISEKAPAFIIAEIGNNHQGDIALAKKLVDRAVEAGADCAKFQMRNLKQLYKNDGNISDDSADLGAQYTMDILSRFQLSDDELVEVFDYCKSKNIIPLCTPWDLASLDVLEKYGMLAYKVASADFTNYELLEAVANTGKPFFCSTGMSSEAEIKSTVKFLDSLSADYVLLHCNSTYPTPYKDVNLKYITRLKQITGKLIGYSGHERGIAIPVASIALEVCVIEKHLTLDRNLEGNDHKISLLPEEFSEMVVQIRNVEEGLGCDKVPRKITQGELINRENLAKSLVARQAISKGSIITRPMVEVRSPGQGLQPNRLKDLVGRIANRDIMAGDFFYESDISGVMRKKPNYRFNRPFGVPVRYHDYRKIVDGSNLDFVEFHLSYKDMDIDLEHYFYSQENIGFAVHSPELFAGDHILDLSATDENYRTRSINELRRVVDIARQLKRYFPKTPQPVIVVNAGGWNSNGFIDCELKSKKYRLVSESFSHIDLSGVQIAVQTMPPFPWHFGGQSYHNLFLAVDEIIDFCQRNPDIKVCLDVSHTMMACNYYGWDLIEFVKTLSPYIVHMHIVDAKGVDGEGVEIGKGDVDFDRLIDVFDSFCPKVQFIPEVWQGHKNGGEGFWRALEYLERKMSEPL